MMKRSILVATLFILLISVNQTIAQSGLSGTGNDTLSQAVVIHPVIETDTKEGIATREHTYQSELRLGDQLARDFSISKMQDKGFSKRYKNEGEENEDWFGWRKNVLAPFNGTVTKVAHPETTNTPGTMNRKAQPGVIFFENKHGVTVIYAHAREIKVEKGQTVDVGEVVAKVGNNGNSRAPHIHVGAWKNDTPLQIQTNLYAEERHKEEKSSK